MLLTLLACMGEPAALPTHLKTATLTIEGTTGADFSDGPTIAHPDQTVTLRIAPQEGHTVRWYQVFPEIDTWYQNANRGWEKDPYKWTGLQEITYQRVELTDWRGEWEVTALEDGESHLARDPDRSDFHRTDQGSFWLEAELLDATGAVVARTPGLVDNDEQGLLPDVFRLTVRLDDSFLGILSGYQNVPGVFGSVTRQSREYIGVDCADVMVSAYRELHGLHIKRNVNVAHLVEELPVVKRITIDGGTPDKALSWEADIQPGDLIAVRYSGSRQFGHVGALLKDADGDGVLSAGDAVLHAGPHPLKTSYLSRGGFDGEVVLLRPKGPT